MERSLPTGSQYFRRMSGVSLLVSLLSCSLIALYLTALLRFTRGQLESFALVVAGSFAVLFVLSSTSNRRMFQPLMRGLDRQAAGEASEEDVREAFRAAVELPRQGVVVGTLWWIFGGLEVSGLMLWFNPEFPSQSALIMLAGACSGGFVSMIFHFFLLKRTLDDIRDELGARIGDPDARRALVRELPLSWKLGIAVSAVTVVTLVFAIFMGRVHTERAIEGFATALQREHLERVLAGDAAASLTGTEVVWLDPGATRIVEGRTDRLAPGELAAVRGLDGDEGTSVSFDSSHVFVWRRAPDGRIAVAVAEGDAVRSAGAGLGVLLVFGSVAVLVVAGIAMLASRDVSRVTGALLVEVDRMASGDLTGGVVIESEDELGALARGFERMSRTLRRTVGDVVETARGVEGAATEIASITDSLAEVTQDQVQGLQQVTLTMDRIRGGVGGIADSAHELSVSVEESSSSILELGVTGEELSHNAQALSTRVDEVGSSIEQMMVSARQAADSTEALAAAATETSSSVEEMASSLREVDSNASETARLSTTVVELAEGGRHKVGETIRGMEIIRDATDTAQQVIHGLGRRATEIGSILGVIDDVADETNLLALNAAIIAAQAGEHGKAFSVVADEIKDLADKVIASTKEIGDLIRAVQSEVQNAIGAIEGGAESVQTGVGLAAEAGIALEQITRASRESGSRIEEIVTAVQEQSRAAAQVASLMERVRDGSEQIRVAGGEQARGNEVVLRGSSAMSEVAQQVHGATEEQARGARRMTEAIESVRGAVEQINGSLQEQSSACEQISEFMERIFTRTRSNEESAQRMREAMRGLLHQAERLRDGVRQFRV